MNLEKRVLIGTATPWGYGANYAQEKGTILDSQGNILSRPKKEEKEKSLAKKILLKAGTAFLAAYIAFLNGGCKKSNPIIPPTPTPVTLDFEVYNHTQGYLTSFTRNTMSGESVTVKIADLNVSGVDDKRIVIRHDNFGSWVASNLTIGEATFIAPSQKTDYDVYLMNTQDGADYDIMDFGGARLEGERYRVVYRSDRDNLTGPENVWGGKLLEIKEYGAFDQLNQALNYNWGQYGNTDRQPDAGRGNFSYGYGKSEGMAGHWTSKWITINPKQLPTVPLKVAIALAEAFERMVWMDDLGGDDTHKTIQDGGVLNQKGKDYFAYVHVKDHAPVR